MKFQISKSKFQNNSKNAFSMLELLLYTSLVAILTSAVSGFFILTLQSRVKNQTIAEVESQGAQVLQQINQTVRNAQAITTPTSGQSATTLALDVFDSAKDPTTFELISGAIRITEGVNPSIILTNSKITATALNFQNLNGAIRTEFNLTYNNPANRNEFEYEENFYGSATVRQK